MTRCPAASFVAQLTLENHQTINQLMTQTRGSHLTIGLVIQSRNSSVGRALD